MKKSVNVLFIILMLSVCIPQSIHAETKQDKLIRELQEVGQYGTTLEVNHIPYSTNPGWEENVKHCEGVPVEQVKKDAEEIHKRRNHKTPKYPEPIEVTIARKCQPFVISMAANPFLNFIIFFPRIADSIYANLNTNEDNVESYSD